MFGKLLQAFGRKPQPVPLPTQHPTPIAEIIDVTDADFAAQVLQSSRLTVVDCWADWCEPCGPMSAYMTFLATDYGDQLLVAALDAEENPLTCEQYAIMGLPTLLFFQNGVEVERQVGLLPYEELRQRVAARLNAVAATTNPAK